MIASQRARVDERSIKTCLNLLVLVGLCKSLLFSGLYAARAGNRQKSFAGLVHTRGQGSSDKDCLNVLKGEDLRGRSRPSIESGDRRAEIPRRETGA